MERNVKVDAERAKAVRANREALRTADHICESIRSRSRERNRPGATPRPVEQRAGRSSTHAGRDNGQVAPRGLRHRLPQPAFVVLRAFHQAQDSSVRARRENRDYEEARLT